ncbi:prepilin-type N-terminal cleavage/methylation domain-containing protein [Buttiauxella warmboldiae]|uniref:Type II secretion system protein J n=1 Tax=Buttiauxella warmboldiae TaxID=82993 RepID=A0A3N5EB19_9ENTR|nr:type II secretion system protein GspJ [Buttiauxella warmboldiae]RPH29613.1 prepilin-type N-terminal cleavage/methylation domain-containing protein [Buttiauxella warmboldiae]
MPQHPTKHQLGFTLLELMVAILLLSVLALMILQINQLSYRAQSQAEELEQSRSSVQRMMALFERDILQVMARNPAKNQGGFSLTGHSLRFITQDNITAEVMPGRAQSVSVNWVFHEGVLWRQSGNDADSLVNADMIVPQLAGIIGVQWEVFDGGWQNSWRGGDPLPAGLAITLKFASRQSLRRIFVITPQPVPPTAKG